MYGAILGDMIGAPYEFDRGNKTKEFPLFGGATAFTDDSVMTIAVAEALMGSMGASDEDTKRALVSSMQKWGEKYPCAGYGSMFSVWLREKDPRPYDSFGNGSAMRVSAAGWLYDSMEETRRYARLSAVVSHNHEEGIKGAEATASAIFMARTGCSKNEIKEYIISEFNYDLSRSCDEIRPTYAHVESCQETVPEAIIAFLEGNDFEDVIRTAVSIGGDCDTLTCIAGSMAEAFYSVSAGLWAEGRKRLPDEMLAVLDRFDRVKKPRRLYGNERLRCGEKELEFSVMDYWRWSSNNIANRLERGFFAEFLVQTAISGSASGVRYDQSCDLIGRNGLRIEVKSAAIYDHSGKNGKQTSPRFGIAPVKIWNEEIYDFSEERSRPSDVYVFCLFQAGEDREKILDIDNWEFWVVPTKVINEACGSTAQSISLSRLKELQPHTCTYHELENEVYRIC